MVSKNYAGALALTTLLGCSAPSERSSTYVESPPSTALEEKVIGSYEAFLTKDVSGQESYNPFGNRRVSLMYSTKSGPGSPARPINSDLVSNIRDELNSLGAYVLPVGVFSGDYAGDIRLSRHPKMNPADVVVIADMNPGKIPKNLGNVYLVRKDGNQYILVEANKE